MKVRHTLSTVMAMIVLAIVLVISGCSSDDPANPGNTDTGPSAPSDITVDAVAYTEADVSWTDNADDETGFDVEWSLAEDFAVKSTQELAADATATVITGLSAGTHYFLRIRSFSPGGESAWVVAEVTTLSLPAGALVIDEGAEYATSVSVTLTSNMAGVEWMRFANEGSGWLDWEPYATSRAWTLGEGDGAKTVNAQYKDQFEEVYDRSAGIILDTTPPLMSTMFPFTIDVYSVYATSTAVTLNCGVTGATRMQFCNDGGAWSAWGDFANSRSWTLSTSQGIRTVYGHFEDDAGNQLAVSDAIILDSLPPSVTSFRINAGAATTTSLTVTLNNSVVGAQEMRFSSNGSIGWTAWESYSSTKAWTMVGLEDNTISAYAQFRDIAGNIAQVSDDIVYDAFTRLNVTVDRIWVGQDGDPFDAGEWRWTVNYADSDYPTVWYEISSGGSSANDGDTITIDESATITLPNTAGHSWTFKWHGWEADNPPIDDDDNVGTLTRTYSYPYATGSYEESMGSDPTGTFYWEVYRTD